MDETVGFGRCLVAAAFCAVVIACGKPQAASRPVVVMATAPDEPETGTCEPAKGKGDTPLIDDFESVPGQILDSDGRGGWWFNYDDQSGGRLVREEISAEDAGKKGQVLHFLVSGFNKWGAGIGATLHPASREGSGCPYDGSTYGGVRLRARGHGRVRLMLADAATTPAAEGGRCTLDGIRCYDRPGSWVELEEGFKDYDFPFCGMVPEGWGGGTKTLDPSTLFSIQFQSEVGADVEMWLDDLAFLPVEPGASKASCKRACPLDVVPRSARIEPQFSDAPLDDQLTLHLFQQPTTSCGPLTRRYLSFVPRTLRPRTTAPILMVLNGSGTNAESARHFMAHDRFDALATRDQAIIVYANAAPGSTTSPSAGFPNTGSWRQEHFDDGEVDDVDYLERILLDLKDRGVISGDNPVVLAGLSNGGGMVLKAARRRPQRFSGIAALMAYDGEVPEPVPNLVGTPLQRVLIAFTIGDPGLQNGYHETLAVQPAAWATALGLPASAIASPKQALLPDRVIEGRGYPGNSPVVLATRDSRVTQLDMEAPGTQGRVRVLRMDHAGHLWPNPVQDEEDLVVARWGLRNQDFDAADAVWEFLMPRRP